MIRQGDFKPAWWLPGPHAQTLWPSLFRSRPELPLEWERLELPDGDFLDLVHVGRRSAPTVLLLHGLEGNLQSHYAGGLLEALYREGYHGVIMHFRNCSEEPNRLTRSYHSGETGDLQRVLELLRERDGQPVRAVVAISLGGNVLLKWLGETGAQDLVQSAVAISVPFLLGAAADRLDRGLSRLYRRHLINKLRRSYRRKFDGMPSPLDVDLARLHNFWEFDDRITAPLHGFAGVEDYYRRCSCRQFIPGIRTPTLILHAKDDPFMWPDTPPTAEELPEMVTMELCEHGGHVGFIGGALPWRPKYWLEQRVVEYLADPGEEDR